MMVCLKMCTSKFDYIDAVIGSVGCCNYNVTPKDSE